MRFLLVVLLLLTGCAKPDDPVRGDFELPVLGTAGMEASAVPAPRAELTLFLDGRMTLDGVEVTRADLGKRLASLAGPHTPDTRDGAAVESALSFVLRADRDVPWLTIQRVLSTAKLAGIHRYFFAVVYAGNGTEATFGLFSKPYSGGHRHLRRPHGNFLRITSRHVEPAEPAALLPVLRRDGADRPLLVEPDEDVSVGYFLRVLEVLLRSGREEIHIAGVVSSTGSTGGKGMRLDSEAVPSRTVDIPPVPRTGDVVGIHLAGGYATREFHDAVIRDRLLESALDAGGRREDIQALRSPLAELAKEQEEDGSFDGRVRPTALAVLAFLGGGNTHRAGEHQKTVKAGLVWLKRQQEEDGRFSTDPAEHAVGTFAYARAFGQTHSPLLKRCAERAMDALTPGDGSWGVLARREGVLANLHTSGEVGDVAAAWAAALDSLPPDDPTARILRREAGWLLPGKLRLR